MPGATAAINEPWRMAVSYLYRVYGEDLVRLNIPFVRNLKQQEIDITIQMLKRGINSPSTSSCGRLFDGVSALLGVRQRVNYEAQAAIELEQAVDLSERSTYLSNNGDNCSEGALSIKKIILGVVDDHLVGADLGKIAARFHWSLAALFCAAAERARDATGINRVGLSGGVYQNVCFFEHMLELLTAAKFDVLTHREVPANDGGISLGQVVIADAQLHN
jgi:hydrogenase maturation protein HypF